MSQSGTVHRLLNNQCPERQASWLASAAKPRVRHTLARLKFIGREVWCFSTATRAHVCFRFFLQARFLPSVLSKDRPRPLEACHRVFGIIERLCGELTTPETRVAVFFIVGRFACDSYLYSHWSAWRRSRHGQWALFCGLLFHDGKNFLDEFS